MKIITFERLKIHKITLYMRNNTTKLERLRFPHFFL